MLKIIWIIEFLKNLELMDDIAEFFHLINQSFSLPPSTSLIYG